ncbi:hypothetical protein [Kitasatospora sp. MBT66]|uniref:hypothetical protein n=1 Tax=Kitasatospora sp. MBT66 TaxID=1444769 RepID=UPI0011EA6EF6|nr:hypothetical protein [Kitasatospora sp. MBT66]
MKWQRSAAASSAGLLMSLLLSSCGSGSLSSASDGVPESPQAPIDPITYSALQNLESALGEQGRAEFKDTFGALQLDPAGRHVILFATDEGRARSLVEAASKKHPGIETSYTAIRKCQYSRGIVDPAIKLIGEAAESNKLPAPVYSAAMFPDGSGIKIATTKAGTTSKDLKDAVAKLVGDIRVSYEESLPIHNLDATATMGAPMK